MHNGINTSIATFVRKKPHATRGAKSLRRTIIPLEKQFTVNFSDTAKSHDITQSPLLYTKTDGRLSEKNIANYKSAMFLRKKQARISAPIDVYGYDEKVGLFRSRSGLGRAAQAVGSALLPGNMSQYRSPVRSAVWRALTPGGGRGRRRMGGGDRGYRCPAGFQFGGRFTDNRFSTCGAQLFEVPGPLALLARAVRGAVRAPDARVTSLSEVIEGDASPDRAVQIQRMAQIPRNPGLNKPRFDRSVAESINTLQSAPAGEGRMIRRDGVILRPIVPSSVLREFSGNPDMLDGAMIRAVQIPREIAADDVALLAGASMQRISFVAPNGVVMTIERPRPLTVGERRKFGRQLNRAIGETDQYDPGASIRQFAEGTNGAFKYTETYGKIPDPLAFVTVTGADGVERRVRKWVYETFIKKSKRRGSTPQQQERRREQIARQGREATERISGKD